MMIPLWLYDAAAQASLVTHDAGDVALLAYKHERDKDREIERLEIGGRWLDGLKQLALEPRA